MNQIAAIIIPCYNEMARLPRLIERLELELVSLLNDTGFDHVSGFKLIIVDDGSAESVSRVRLRTEPDPRIRLFVVTHPINLGQGAAIETGVRIGLADPKTVYFITMDGDGQHDVADLRQFLGQMASSGADIVFGNRFGKGVALEVPMTRKLLLYAALIFERFVTGLALNDAHNGYRVFNRSFAEVLRLRQNRMAHATEIKLIVKRHRARYAEVPVSIAYTEETLRKGQSNLGAVRILHDLIKVFLFSGN
ncbi:MAG: glycosyltransferase family 2 protein [Silvanigrellales bacterium]|nr:glycosyltransferase family 2 protein [Silvanigrellales bacterium]